MGPLRLRRMLDREPGSGKNNAWQLPVLLLFGSYAIVLVSFRQTLHRMVQTWYESRTYSHCFLIAPLSVFLIYIWVRRGRVSGLTPSPNYWGLPLVGLLSAIWLGGTLGEVRCVQEFALVSVLIAATWTIMGSRV